MNYYILERQNDNSHPLLKWADDDPREITMAKNLEVAESPPIRLRLGKPVPRKPVMVDYHVEPNPVVSERLQAILEPMSLFMVQLVPADVEVKGETLRYWYVYVRNTIECLDMKRSQYALDGSGRIMIPEKMVLDEKKLAEIPEEKRLLFRLREYETLWFAHEKLKAALEAVNPIGLRFFHTRDWSDAAAFR